MVTAVIIALRNRAPSYPWTSSLVLSQSSIVGQNPKIGCQEFNDLHTPKLSKKQLCDRTRWRPWVVISAVTWQRYCANKNGSAKPVSNCWRCVDLPGRVVHRASQGGWSK